MFILFFLDRLNWIRLFLVYAISIADNNNKNNNDDSHDDNNSADLCVFGILIKYGDFYGFEFETHFGFMPQHGFSSYFVAFNNHVMLFIIIFVSVFIFYSVPCVRSLSPHPSFSSRFGRLNLQVINTTQFCKITMLNDQKLPEIVFHIEYFWRVILSLYSQVKCFMHDLIQPNRRKKHIHLKIKSAFIANLFDICNSIAINRGISIFGGRFDALIWRTTSWTWHFFSVMSSCWINMENIKYYPFGTKWFNVHLLGDRDIGKVILVMHSTRAVQI